MKKFDLALCDQDSTYVTMLASYLMQKAGEQVGINIFTTPESFFADSKDYHLAILTEEFLEVSAFKQSGSIAKKYILTEKKSMNEENQIFKYQSADEIINRISEFETLKGSKKASTKKSDKSKIIGVYSPVSHELALPFSMAVGNSYKDYGKVLFLDFEELSILPELINIREADRNLSDLLYEISTCNKKMSFENYVQQFMGFDYISPFAGPDEISQIDEKTWISLFETLKAGEYDTIIVLFGCAIRGFSEILSYLDKLYVLGKPGDYFRKGQELFNSYLGKLKKDIDAETIILPMSAANLSEGTYCIEELLQGNLGLFVKREIVVA